MINKDFLVRDLTEVDEPCHYKAWIQAYMNCVCSDKTVYGQIRLYWAISDQIDYVFYDQTVQCTVHALIRLCTCLD